MEFQTILMSIIRSNIETLRSLSTSIEKLDAKITSLPEEEPSKKELTTEVSNLRQASDALVAQINQLVDHYILMTQNPQEK